MVILTAPLGCQDRLNIGKSPEYGDSGPQGRRTQAPRLEMIESVLGIHTKESS